MPTWLDPILGMLITMVVGAAPQLLRWSPLAHLRAHKIVTPLVVVITSLLLPPEYLVGGDPARSAALTTGTYSMLKNVLELILKRPVPAALPSGK